MTATVQKRFCIPCNNWTEYERETTLPPQYRCGDPDYADKTKCGRCGEIYQCQECGAALDITAGQCSDVLDHGYHGPEHDWWQVIADGTPWEDADGRTRWERGEAVALAEVTEAKGYAVELRPE